MIVPVEAELARPPILTEADEATLRNEALENHHLPSHVHEKAKPDGPNSNNTSATQSVDLESAELAEKAIIVEFEEGESPREWSRARKWLVTATTSSLCLSVALGSSLPTGE